LPGGSSGIGLATAKLFSDRGALVFNIDVQPPTIQQQRPEIEYVKCDQSSWSELLITFKRWPQIDIVVANGGVTEYPNYFDDVFDEQGELEEPCQAVFRVNLIGTINVCKLAMSRMRKQESGGSIVITSSATALMPEHSLPVYGACKAAVSTECLITSNTLTDTGRCWAWSAPYVQSRYSTKSPSMP
jgi:NAD(P)-dependent dehydrogenase (short-subunit alcohol dehydrogenase family)